MTGTGGAIISGSGTNITIDSAEYSLLPYPYTPNEYDSGAYLDLVEYHNGGYSRDIKLLLAGGNNVTVAQGPTTGFDYGIITIDATDTTLNSVTAANNATSGFDITVADSSSNSDSATIDPKITLGTHTAAADQISFVNGVANLPVYTKTEIDDMNKALDALVYRGTVGVGGSIAVSAGDPVMSFIADAENDEIKVGYVYKVVGSDSDTYYIVRTKGNITYDTARVHPGDLIIANGGENEDGYIYYRDDNTPPSNV